MRFGEALDNVRLPSTEAEDGYAAEAHDSEGRKIITAQEFVVANNVCCVFGAGGAYDLGHVLIIVVFARDSVPRHNAEQFLTLATLFQNQTNGLVTSGRIFSAE